jgi:hypothetical protein
VGEPPGQACQLIQFFSGIGEWEGLLLGAFADCEAEFVWLPAFRAILFLALPGDVPRVNVSPYVLSAGSGGHPKVCLPDEEVAVIYWWTQSEYKDF